MSQIPFTNPTFCLINSRKKMCEMCGKMCGKMCEVSHFFKKLEFCGQKVKVTREVTFLNEGRLQAIF